MEIAEIAEGARTAGATWSTANQRLLDRSRGRPALRRRASFAPVHQGNPLPTYPRLQSWPVFADGLRVRELERVAVGLTRLFRGIPSRFFADDPRQMAAFYSVDQPELLAAVMARPNAIEAALARVDFLEDGSGLRCLELNAGSYLGGWFTEFLEPLYLSCPELAGFLREDGLAARHRPTIRRMFSHIVRDTRRRGIWREGELNLAVVLYPQVDSYLKSVGRPDLLQREYEAALSGEDGALRGRVFICGYGDLEPAGAALRYRGCPVHALLEQQSGPTDRVAFRCFKAGGVNLFSGPVTMLLSDKRNLALLSEAADGGGGLIDGEEKDLVRRHLPWTRRVARATAIFGGEEVFLPDLLAGRREELVLKGAQSLGGADVHIGRFLSATAWETVVQRALAEPGWIVQEEVRSLPWLFPGDDEELAVFDVVWGIFVFGEEYGGTFVRMLPRERRGTVNVLQGCDVGIVLEVDAG
ncbi:MAG TPA: hypothetical protein VOA87_20620 [Thermoanaerobaculia bacterium]|nr:hypothetical protein [Thermoanaerobaculia bacterium]